ncbi:uncharacterized protein LOC132899007 [Neoarius graeffei]|uniref:uncharacterized protein LOC132899007 n=1 Tax=Neoarius graeffei TaxID=443677 RepID=UPI00298C913F|nr:uncharacterized protein LOC132899007 [Neoarius graeffei]
MEARKAAGPDSINPGLLRHCADQLCGIVRNIFNLSLEQERVPVLWKTSCVVPRPKTAHPTDLNGYRPVALTSHLMKALERLVLAYLRPLVGPAMDPVQYAYQPGIGVEDAVIYLLHRSFSHLEKAGSTVRFFCKLWWYDYRVRGQYHQTFNKDVILLTNSTWTKVCTHQTKEQLYQAGNILSAFEFDKSWTYHTIISQIRDGFGDKIPPDISLSCLMGCGKKKLVSPVLRDGQELNGSLLHKIFHLKALYVRPSKPLANDCLAHSDSEGERADHCTGAIVSQGITVALNDESSDSCVEVQTPSSKPPKRRGRQESPPRLLDDGPSTSSSNYTPSGSHPQAASTSAGSEYSAYVSIMSSLPDMSSSDEELNCAILASIDNQMNTMPCDKPASEILLQLASKITPNKTCKFNINRQSVLDGAIRGFKRVSYDPTATISLSGSRMTWEPMRRLLTWVGHGGNS